MPEYSTLTRERDVYGELGWIPNFNVKNSKNNLDRHGTYKEYFDAPKEYHTTFTNATVTNTEFFRQNAPEGSVSKHSPSKTLVHSPSPLGSSQGSFHEARRSFNAVERQSFTHMRSSSSRFPKTQHQFILDQDTTNLYKYDPTVQRTIDMPNSIPFLRDVRDTSNHNWHKSHLSGAGEFAMTPTVGKAIQLGSKSVRRARSRDLRKRKVRELAWNGYEMPISKYNEGVHRSNRIPFEKIWSLSLKNFNKVYYNNKRRVVSLRFLGKHFRDLGELCEILTNHFKIKNC